MELFRCVESEATMEALCDGEPPLDLIFHHCVKITPVCIREECTAHVPCCGEWICLAREPLKNLTACDITSGTYKGIYMYAYRLAFACTCTIRYELMGAIYMYVDCRWSACCLLGFALPWFMHEHVHVCRQCLYRLWCYLKAIA